MDYINIGERIRNRRKEINISQETLIEQLQILNLNRIGRNTLSKLENGESTDIKFETICGIAEILNCDIGYLIGMYDEHCLSVHEISETTGLTESSVDYLTALNKANDYELLNLLNTILSMRPFAAMLFEAIHSYISSRDKPAMLTVDDKLSMNVSERQIWISRIQELLDEYRHSLP